GTSTIALNAANLTVTSWSDSSIVAVVPSGASSGTFSVTVNGNTATSSTFTVTALPGAWSDADIGSVSAAGSASYTNGTFNVNSSGLGLGGSTDTFHYVYQSLSGDGTIVARVASLAVSIQQVGVMIRETLAANSSAAFVF